jgi:hypothetical protein
MKNRDNIVPLYVLVRPATAAFVTRAAKHAGVSVSEMARDAVVGAAAKVLKSDPPKVEAFSKGGHPGLISQAASKAGLTVAQLKNKLATEALGGKWAAPKKPAKKAKK